MTRTAVTLDEKKKIAQIKEIYEYLKTTEDWLYKKGAYAKRPP